MQSILHGTMTVRDIYGKTKINYIALKIKKRCSF